MKEINKSLNNLLILSIVITLMLVVSPALIVFGAIKNIVLLLVVGIVFAVVGFYGTAFSWVFYSEKLKLKRVAMAVILEKIYSVKQIAGHLQMPEEVVAINVKKLVEKMYINGFLFDGQNLVENTNIKKTTNYVKCQVCGANLSYDNNVKICPYCGAKYNLK